MDKPNSRTLGLLPLRNLVLFPGVVMPVDVGRPGSLQLVEDVVRHQPARLVVATQRDKEIESPGLEDLHPIGVEAEVLRVVKVADSRYTLVLRGLMRVRLNSLAETTPYLQATVSTVDETNVDSAQAEGLALAIKDKLKKVIKRSPEIPDENIQIVEAIHEAGRIADVAQSNLDLDVDARIALLLELDVEARAKKVMELVEHRLQVFEVKEKIDTQVREEMGRHQREAVLRQKLKAIQEELGEGDDGEDLSELEEKITKAEMPEDVAKIAKKQLDRLRAIQTGSAEYNVQRTYLEWLTDLPWSKRSEDKMDVAAARAVLEADHYGIEKVKKRVLEYLAVRKLAPKKKAPILCLYGPPGVGKTSLGRSIAHALGREFVRVSLGGVRDEAEVRGHRRTYIGALPGRIIQALKRAGTRNPVFILDEIDKLASDFRGDPSSALLEVLDPEQNFSFSDHYLEVPFDLSEIIFIATANDLSTIQGPLRDRMEILELPGYTRQEKHAIAVRHLIPKQIGEHGLDAQAQLTISGPALDDVIDHYTREAGVRNLEREIANLVRGVAVHVASNEPYPHEILPEHLPEYLGPQRFFSETVERTEVPGVATGLAWTPVGGTILFIEATRMPGKGGMVLTGQLGDVMKESATAAMSYVRSHAVDLGVPIDFLDKSDIHLHVPAGGTPKDGPSAGTTMAVALVSLLTGRRVRSDVAMTGEITLRGNVLPVGGIKEKVLAAHRAGLKRVILPERNQKDLVDIPEEIRADVEFVFAKKIGDSIAAALEPAPVIPVTVEPDGAGDAPHA
jgi:ATP-dependent Lon protease